MICLIYFQGYTDVDITEGDKKSGKLLGGDTHDYVNHGTGSIQADKPDLVHDAVNLLGAVRPGLVQQARKMVSEAKPDLMKNAKNVLDAVEPVQDAELLLGEAKPVLVKHAKKLLSVGKLNAIKDELRFIGVDSYDFVKHSKKRLIGQDGHDLKPHGKSAGKVKQNCSAMFEDFKKNHKKLYGTRKGNSVLNHTLSSFNNHEKETILEKLRYKKKMLVNNI